MTRVQSALTTLLWLRRELLRMRKLRRPVKPDELGEALHHVDLAVLELKLLRIAEEANVRPFA